MSEISASAASRQFENLLDEVEHQKKSFTIMRRGQPIGRLSPVTRSNVKALKAIMQKHKPDPEFARDIAQVSALLY